MPRLYLLLAALLATPAFSQNQPAPPRPRLTVETIMQDPRNWMGTAPSNTFWAEDGKTLYFSWNPQKAKGDSLYKVTLAGDRKPVKVGPAERRALPDDPGVYNRDQTLKVYERNGDLFLVNCRTFQTRQLTNTVEREVNPAFSGDEQAVVFQRGGNLFKMAMTNGDLTQLTNFDSGTKKPDPKPNAQEALLKKEQLSLFDILRERKDKKDEGERITKADQPKRAKLFYTEGRTLMGPRLSPDGKFITFTLAKAAAGAKSAVVPSYVTESGFTEELPARTKVGAPLASYELFVYDVDRDTVQTVSLRTVPGIMDKLNLAGGVSTSAASTSAVSTGAASTSAGSAKADTSKKAAQRSVTISSVLWSPAATNRYAVLVLRSQDNKDRWIMQLDPAARTLKLIDRQHDDAWVGGPNIGFGPNPGTLGFLADGQTLYFQSEVDGYSHLYTVNLATGERKQLTTGKFEVQRVVLSKNKQYFFLTTNEQHPGEQHLYRMAVTGGSRERLTTMTGANDVTLSPDETMMAIRHSYSNRPWELYLAELAGGKSKNRKEAGAQRAQPQQLTDSPTAGFKAYPWRDPQVVTIPARDGQPIYARLYKPDGQANGKAVVFVHGAGYLQNAHKWWSQYFREYMFHNLLVDQGYTVLDIDYRASAGYGRDWRTGIYRFMGGKDLTDHVDAAEWLVKNHGVDAKRIGIYGGSYGGFITLMAMFTTPGTFAAGAALRPVTDWAAYNHGYTANILNEPQTDSLAYHRSSPIYFADGLKGHLLICHGMVDVNVHYQDAVRLVQRLIELKKENWELASYPMEDHGFVEPTSWMDEYKRILKLFNERL